MSGDGGCAAAKETWGAQRTIGMEVRRKELLVLAATQGAQRGRRKCYLHKGGAHMVPILSRKTRIYTFELGFRTRGRRGPVGQIGTFGNIGNIEPVWDGGARSPGQFGPTIPPWINNNQHA